MDCKMQVVFFISAVLAYSASAESVKVKIPKSDYVWEPYPEDTLPLFQKAFQDIAESESKLALLFHAWNILPRNGIYVAPDDLANDISTEAPQESTSEQDGTEPTAIGDEIHSVLNFNPDAFQDRWGLELDVDEIETDPRLDRLTSEEDFTNQHELRETSDAFQDRLGMVFSALDEIQSGPSAALVGGQNVDDSAEVVAVRGTPGKDFPDYHDIPETSFACSEQGYIPGFYADLETGCQAFHVCWPHKKETLLCPIGTLFNQAILSCDFWYTTNCSLAPLLYDLNARVPDSVFYHEKTPADDHSFIDWTRSPKFHPVASKTEVYPEGAGGNAVKRRHVPKEDGTTTTTTTAADADDHQQEVVQQPATARLLPEVSTTSPLRKAVRINSKFIAHPLFVIRREVWQRALKDMVGGGEEDAEGTTLDAPEETLCGVPRQRLVSLVKELVAENFEEIKDRAARAMQ